MTRRGRPPGRTRIGAILAVAGVGGELEDAGRRALLGMCLEHDTLEAAAQACGHTARNFRRILHAWGTCWSRAPADLSPPERRSA